MLPRPRALSLLARAVLAVLAIAVAAARAQEELRTWRTFTRADGLPSNGVLDVIEDRRGDVWVACYGGVGRYERESGTWTRFERVTTREGREVSLDEATSLAEQDDLSPESTRGSIWVGTDGEGLLVRRPDGTWESADDHGVLGGLPSRHVHALLFARDGALWVGLDGLVCRRDPRSGRWQIFGPQVETREHRLPLPEHRPVYTLHEDLDHRIWVGGYDFGAHVWVDGRWVSFDENGVSDPRGEFCDTSEQLALPHRYIYAARHDTQGRIWLLGFGGGISLLSRDLRQLLPLPAGFVPASESVCDLAVDQRTQDLWFATYEGLSQLSLERRSLAHDGAPWRHHRSGPYLASGFFRRAHYGARSGTLWFANRGGGLVARLGVGYRLWQQPDGDAAGGDDVRGGLAVDGQGAVWGATQQRVFVRDEDGTPRREWRTSEIGLGESSELQCLHGDRYGHIWVGSSRGLARWDGERWQVVVPALVDANGARTELRDLNVWEITRDRQERLWLATRNAGAIYYVPAQERWTQILPERFDAPRKGLPSRTVYCIFEDRDGDLWFGTLEGLARWRETAPEPERWRLYDDAQDGLSSKRVYAIQQDPRGRLWIGSLRAVDRRTPADRFETVRGEQSQGLLEDGNYCFRILATPDGSLWFAIVGAGIVRYDPREEQWTGYRLPEDLAGVAVRGVAISQSGRLWIATSRGLLSYDRDTARPQVWLPEGNPTVLSSEGRGTFLALGRDVLQRTPPEELRYRFRIDDEAWSSYRSEPLLRVEKLDPGRHRLEVQAFDRDFNASPSAYLLFEVERPWWQHPLTLGIALGVLIALAGAALVMRSVEARRRSELERAETLSAAVSGIVSGGLPSFLGPQSSEVGAGVLGHSDTAEYESLLRSGLRLVPDVRLSALAQQVIAAWQQRSPDLRFDLRVQSGELGANLDPEKLRLAIDHLVRNAVEAMRDEGRAGTIALEIARAPRRPWRAPRLFLRVKDDGPGIPEDVLARLGTPFNSHGKQRHAGLGLYHCHQVAELHGGALRLRRLTPQGTEAELELSAALQA
jgi:ligand-binding sensor domain-containing protein/anti-sigma regulatory factor (Ser/Thr protein kinase)